MAKVNSKAEVTGLKELEKALAGFIPKLQNKAIRHGSRKAAQHVQRVAKSRAPEGDPNDPHYSSESNLDARAGSLKRNIKVRALPRSRTTTGAQITVGGGKLFTGENYYAGFQEFGWIHTGSGKGRRGNGTKIEGRSFLRSSLYDSAADVHRIYVDEAQTKLDAIAKELLVQSGGLRVARVSR